MFGGFEKKIYLCIEFNSNWFLTMTATTWESLPVEVRKYLVQKRIEASDKYQGSATVEKYGVYMKD